MFDKHDKTLRRARLGHVTQIRYPNSLPLRFAFEQLRLRPPRKA